VALLLNRKRALRGDRLGARIDRGEDCDHDRDDGYDKGGDGHTANRSGEASSTTGKNCSNLSKRSAEPFRFCIDDQRN
jgi:hypothetical protein